MTNAFVIDIHHFGVHYVISSNHSAVRCPGGDDRSPTRSEDSVRAGGEVEAGRKWVGVARDTRRGKWRAVIRASGKDTVLGFFDSPEVASTRRPLQPPRPQPAPCCWILGIFLRLGIPCICSCYHHPSPHSPFVTQAAARKHDAVAIASGRTSALNFPLLAAGTDGVGAGVHDVASGVPAAVAGRWAWKCDVGVNGARAARAIAAVVAEQAKHCPGLWPRRDKPR